MPTDRFREFLAGYHPDIPVEWENGEEYGEVLALLLAALGNRSYNSGVYRIHNQLSSSRWTSIVRAAFPSRDPNFQSFGFDWLGRQYCLDTYSNLVVQFDPETGESYATQCTLLEFHNDELINQSNDAIAVDEFRKWAQGQSKPLLLSECVGYRIPLILGGEDCLENRERSEMEVYWSFCAQISAQLSNVESGTPIKAVRLSHEN